MPPNTTKNNDINRKEAWQALLNSLGHGKDDQSDGQLSAGQVRKLSQKINEILGDGADHSPTQGNEPRLLNEEGLPVIDISEPVHEDPPSSPSPLLIPEPEFIPLSVLLPDETERRRRERDRILDLLEEEERLQQLQEERDTEEERKEAIRKRKELAKVELEQLKATRALQKKMGWALVRHAKGTEERREDEDARLKPQVTSPVATKSVSFADAPAVDADTREQQASVHHPDLGDITLGRLRAQVRIPLVSAADAQKYPMKIHVVERHPTVSTASPFHSDADSDDESDSARGHSPHIEDNSSDGKDRFSSSDNDLLDDEPLEEGFDYDAAQHHREVALEYYKKRHAIGAETAKVVAAHDLDGHKQHETLPLSPFQADRMATAYDKSHSPVSNPIEHTIQKSLRNSVKLGKLENDQLVGGESGESGSEDETMREIVQMLKTGNVRNAGPDFEPSSMTTIAHPNSEIVEPTTVGTSSAATHGTKPSRFKLACGGIIERTIPQDNDSTDNVHPQPTISNVIERKAPRSSHSQHFSVNKPPSRSTVKAAEPARPIIIDSPSLPPPASTSFVFLSSHPMQDSTIQPQMSSRDPLSTERPTSRFITEREY